MSPRRRLLLVAALAAAVWMPAAAQASGGFFGPPTNFPVGLNEPLSVAAADFDGDSDPDLAVTGGDTLSILLGGAGGGFGAPATIDAGSGERTVTVGDFNGDADPDLAVTNSFTADVSILLGDAGASFSAPAHFGAESPFSATVGDLNGDSDPDLAVPNTGHNTVSILLGAAGGSFTGPTSFSTGPEFSFPRAVAVGDFDADLNSDLAVANYGSAGSDVAILLGDGSGSFSAPTHFPVAEGYGGATSIAAGDFNGDSDPDLAVAADNCCLSILFGGAAGTFTAPNNMAAGLAPGAVVIGNFNGDSDPDLAVANGASDDVSILLGGAGGSFTDATNFPSGGGSPRALAVGDFNGDADPDLALANLYTDDVSILLGAAPAPELTINDVSHEEGNAGTTTYSFTVTRTGYTGATSRVHFATEDGSATVADDDYEATAVPASIVANGDVEQPNISPRRYLPAYPPGFDGWAVDSGSVDIVRDLWPAASGVQSIDLNGVCCDAGSISQNLPTAPNEQYILSFAFAGNPDPNPVCGSSPQVKRMEVFWGGTSLGVFTFDIAGHSLADIGWERQSVPATAGASTTALRFTSLIPGACGPALDDVAVRQTSGDLVFAPGEVSKRLEVTVSGDVRVEPDEQFKLKLSNPVDATISDGEGVGTIQNDDLSPSQPCTIFGTKGDDSLSGGLGDDVICAGGGDDQVFGGPGRDLLIGGNGRDLLDGDLGSDLLLGGGGYDDLRGGDGNDTLKGEEGGDTLLGGPGSDALFGQIGLDTLNTRDGVRGNDSADGGPGSDKCTADPGDFLTVCP